MSAQNPPITCHVLNTVTGLPAAGISVKLKLLRPLGPSNSLQARTNDDGRVTEWQTPAGGPSLEEVFANAADGADGGKMVWVLTFDVGGYFRGEGFWEEIEIRFKTEVHGVEGEKKHWHVPLLLSPWSYTTYRGS